MEDKQELTIKKYGFQVKSRYRARGAVLLDTGEGPCLMREYEKITAHFEFENMVKEILHEKGMTLTDRVVKNIDGDLVTEWESGEKYVVYRWFLGENCDYRNDDVLFEATKNLGNIHRNLKNVSEEPISPEECLLDKYRRHNSEMKRVYSFMKSKKRKSEFEIFALSCFPAFYEKAKQAEKRLMSSAYYQKCGSVTRDICHGEYNYHNLLVTGQGLATTNFERAAYGVQLMDLAYFFRKVMEKNSWDIKKGKAMISGYASGASMNREEMEFLEIVLSYPIKYWKILNQYMNGKKSWISNKNMEKLIGVKEQEKEKDLFLKSLSGI